MFSLTTVDGSELLHQLRLVVYPIIYKLSFHPSGWEWDFWSINSCDKITIGWQVFAPFVVLTLCHLMEFQWICWIDWSSLGPRFGWNFGQIGVSLNGGTPKTPQNDIFSRKTLGTPHMKWPKKVTGNPVTLNPQQLPLQKGCVFFRLGTRVSLTFFWVFVGWNPGSIGYTVPDWSCRTMPYSVDEIIQALSWIFLVFVSYPNGFF